MTYKHGNWYCKPASEEEAREIIERAVASGAERNETVGLTFVYEYKWCRFDAWGVSNGKTYTGDIFDRGPFGHATEYTIEQVRDKFLLPGEQGEAEQKWIPPVGTVCEAFTLLYASPCKPGHRNQFGVRRIGVLMQRHMPAAYS